MKATFLALSTFIAAGLAAQKCRITMHNYREPTNNAEYTVETTPYFDCIGNDYETGFDFAAKVIWWECDSTDWRQSNHKFQDRDINNAVGASTFDWEGTELTYNYTHSTPTEGDAGADGQNNHILTAVNCVNEGPNRVKPNDK